MDGFLRLMDGFLYRLRNCVLRFLFAPDTELLRVQNFDDLAIRGPAYPDIVLFRQVLQMATYRLFVGLQISDDSLQLDRSAAEHYPDAVLLLGDGVNPPQNFPTAVTDAFIVLKHTIP